MGLGQRARGARAFEVVARQARMDCPKRVYSPKCYWPEKYDTGDVTCLFGRIEIPNDHDSVTFEVRPLNAWGKPGEPIMTEPATYDKAKVLYPF